MLTLTVVTPERRAVGPIPVASVSVPGVKGEMTILPGHARLVSILDTGVVSFETTGGKRHFGAVSTGFVEVHQDHVTVVAETLELSNEINVDRARRAFEKAEEKLKAKEGFEQDMEKWRRKMQRAQIRLQAARFLLPPH